MALYIIENTTGLLRMNFWRGTAQIRPKNCDRYRTSSTEVDVGPVLTMVA